MQLHYLLPNLLLYTINYYNFLSDLSIHFPPLSPFIDILNKILIMTLNTLAPINTKYISLHPNTPCYNSAISSQKRALRHKERIYVI